MFVCKFCNKNFSVKYQLTKGYPLTFCSKSCKSKEQRGKYPTKKSLVSAIEDFVKSSGCYKTKDDIISNLGISSKTLVKFGVSTALINKKCGMKKPQSVFEDKVGNFLGEIFDGVESQVSFEDLISPKGYPLKFDFFVPKERLVIEADGSQHGDVNHVYSSEYTVECDEIKDFWCNEKGITLIRIPYTRRVTEDYVRQFI